MDSCDVPQQGREGHHSSSKALVGRSYFQLRWQNAGLAQIGTVAHEHISYALCQRWIVDVALLFARTESRLVRRIERCIFPVA
jgi:hypothetical protein